MQITNIQDQILQHWKSVANRRNGLPSRKDFRLQDLGKNALDIVVVDIKTDPTDFTYRLIGSNVAENLSENFTGKSLSSIPGKGPKSQIWANMKAARDEKKPLLREAPYVGSNEKQKMLQTLYLPLASDHQNPDKLMLVPSFPPKRKMALFSAPPQITAQEARPFN